MAYRQLPPDVLSVPWSRVEPIVWSGLDDPDPIARAEAANALGGRYATDPEESVDQRGLPSILEALEVIRHKEIERPGVAGPFLFAVMYVCQDPQWLQFNLTEWMLNILRRCSAPEPDVRFNSLEFYAHEQMCNDAAAVAALVDMGRLELAVAAATEERRRVEGFEPLLVRLSESGIRGVAEPACEHLTRFYRFRRP
jgi:hypothetical protein